MSIKPSDMFEVLVFIMLFVAEHDEKNQSTLMEDFNLHILTGVSIVINP